MRKLQHNTVMTNAIFTVLPDGAGSLAHPIVLGGLAVSLACSVGLWRRPADGWTPGSAWLRAFQYFGLACALGYVCGTWPALFSKGLSLAPADGSLLWWVLTVGWLAQVVVAYTIIWPRGTFTAGRRAYPFTSALYGLCWGVFHSQVFLSVWALAELGGLGRLWVALLSYAVISAFNGLWHSRYWDVRVSPPHNIEEWNARKVAFCHVPNLALGLAHLALFENPLLFVAVQTFALTASACFMRFPRWDDRQAA